MTKLPLCSYMTMLFQRRTTQLHRTRMMPEQWTSPCGNQCNDKYAALTKIPCNVTPFSLQYFSFLVIFFCLSFYFCNFHGRSVYRMHAYKHYVPQFWNCILLLNIQVDCIRNHSNQFFLFYNFEYIIMCCEVPLRRIVWIMALRKQYCLMIVSGLFCVSLFFHSQILHV